MGVTATQGRRGHEGERGLPEDRRRQAPRGIAAAFTLAPSAAAGTWTVRAAGAPLLPPARRPPDAATLPPARLSIERGEDRTRLVIAFTGFGGRLAMPAFDFLGVTGLMGASRILLRDSSRLLYLDGIPPFATGFDALLERLREAVAELAPERTMVIGNSGGSHAALLFGHLLGADVVHAFAPITNIDPAHIRAVGIEERLLRHADVIDRLDALPPTVRRYFDLRQVLGEGNGRTRFHLHACARSPIEMRRAQHLEGLPGVAVHRHPCDGHGVVGWLARNERLLPILRGDTAQGAGAP